MTLSEKITALRTGRKLSQGDVAERLDVSRQSVSKWETGQSVPELDKIVRLADLFGVSVDELVRDGDAPQPQPQPEAEKRIVYVQRRFTPVQTLGIILIASGLVFLPLGLMGNSLLFIGAFLVISALPLLLARKHPFLITGWVVWAMGYLLLCTPFFTGVQWQPFSGAVRWCPLFLHVEAHGPLPLAVVLVWLAYVGESVLTVLLPVLTVRLALSRWRARQADRAAAPEHPGP